jgi:hypothetical protein
MKNVCPFSSCKSPNTSIIANRGIFIISSHTLCEFWTSVFFEVFFHLFLMKISELFSNLGLKIQSDKRILSGIIVTTVAILSVGGYLGHQEFSKRWSIPMVS